MVVGLLAHHQQLAVEAEGAVVSARARRADRAFVFARGGVDDLPFAARVVLADRHVQLRAVLGHGEGVDAVAVVLLPQQCFAEQAVGERAAVAAASLTAVAYVQHAGRRALLHAAHTRRVGQGERFDFGEAVIDRVHVHDAGPQHILEVADRGRARRDGGGQRQCGFGVPRWVGCRHRYAQRPADVVGGEPVGLRGDPRDRFAFASGRVAALPVGRVGGGTAGPFAVARSQKDADLWDPGDPRQRLGDRDPGRPDVARPQQVYARGQRRDAQRKRSYDQSGKTPAGSGSFAFPVRSGHLNLPVPLPAPRPPCREHDGDPGALTRVCLSTLRGFGSFL